MDKRIFDFQDKRLLDGLSPGTGVLQVIVGIDGFSLLVTDAAGAVAALREWAFSPSSPDFSAAEMDLRTIFGSEDLLSRGYAQVRCSLFNTTATLVPRRLFRPDDNLAAYFDLLLPRPDAFEFDYTECPEIDGYLVFAYEPVVKRLCEHYFPAARPGHLAAPLIRSWRRLAPPDGPAIYANVRNSQVQIAVFERGSLLLYNTYAFHHANDLLYFVLLAYEQFRLIPAETPLTLTGNVLTESDLYRQLYRYIRHIAFAEPTGLQLPAEARALPAHCHFDIAALND